MRRDCGQTLYGLFKYLPGRLQFGGEKESTFYCKPLDYIFRVIHTRVVP